MNYHSNKKKYCITGFSSNLPVRSNERAKSKRTCKMTILASSAKRAAEKAFAKHGVEGYVYLYQQKGSRQKKTEKIFKGKINDDPTVSYGSRGTKVRNPFTVTPVSESYFQYKKASYHLHNKSKKRTSKRHKPHYKRKSRSAKRSRRARS